MTDRPTTAADCAGTDHYGLCTSCGEYITARQPDSEALRAAERYAAEAILDRDGADPDDDSAIVARAALRLAAVPPSDPPADRDLPLATGVAESMALPASYRFASDPPHEHEWERLFRDGVAIAVRCKECHVTPLDWLDQQLVVPPSAHEPHAFTPGLPDPLERCPKCGLTAVAVVNGPNVGCAALPPSDPPALDVERLRVAMRIAHDETAATDRLSLAIDEAALIATNYDEMTRDARLSAQPEVGADDQ